MDQTQCLHEKIDQREDSQTVFESPSDGCEIASECCDDYKNLLAAVTSHTITEKNCEKPQVGSSAVQRTVKFDTPVKYFDEFQNLLNSMQGIC